MRCHRSAQRDRLIIRIVTPSSAQITREGDIDRLRLTFPTSGNPRRFCVLEVISD